MLVRMQCKQHKVLLPQIVDMEGCRVHKLSYAGLRSGLRHAKGLQVGGEGHHQILPFTIVTRSRGDPYPCALRIGMLAKDVLPSFAVYWPDGDR